MSESLFPTKPFGEPLRETPHSPQTLMPDLPTSPTPPSEERGLDGMDVAALGAIGALTTTMAALRPESLVIVLPVLGIAAYKAIKKASEK
jgi:hypothetical protein